MTMILNNRYSENTHQNLKQQQHVDEYRNGTVTLSGHVQLKLIFYENDIIVHRQICLVVIH